MKLDVTHTSHSASLLAEDPGLSSAYTGQMLLNKTQSLESFVSCPRCPSSGIGLSSGMGLRSGVGLSSGMGLSSGIGSRSALL